MENLGLWVLSTMVVLATIRAISALLSRRLYRELEARAVTVLNSPIATKADQAWVSLALTQSLNRLELPAKALFTPIALIGLTFSDLFYGNHNLTTSNLSDEVERLKAQVDRAEAAWFEEEYGLKASDAAFWDTNERREIYALVERIQALNSPISSFFILLSILIVAPIWIIAHLLGKPLGILRKLDTITKAKFGRLLLDAHH